METLKINVKTIAILLALALTLSYAAIGEEIRENVKVVADKCSGAIVGVQCIGTIISGTGNSNQGGGRNRPILLTTGL